MEFFRASWKKEKKKPRKIASRRYLLSRLNKTQKLRFATVPRNANFSPCSLAEIPLRIEGDEEGEGGREMVVHPSPNYGGRAAMPSGNFRPRIEMLLR